MVEGGTVLVRVDLGDIIEMDHGRITASQSRGWDGLSGGRRSLCSGSTFRLAEGQSRGNTGMERP
ncbi:hypothetical protein GCM10010116_23980 [Microbispora rosea subsp. aerata]|nr:hypothetical protein GCM10010116_23980 [Microbispora rosea subsp. aerata]GIH55673.1 hypothetical protein Mro02_25870 [Microbispora rosea subsp. aerata]GLJ86029.1 hypothetical protein GCM10017588_47620 [Microbispora rosea subsp. aerata]